MNNLKEKERLKQLKEKEKQQQLKQKEKEKQLKEKEKLLKEKEKQKEQLLKQKEKEKQLKEKEKQLKEKEKQQQLKQKEKEKLLKEKEKLQQLKQKEKEKQLKEKQQQQNKTLKIKPIKKNKTLKIITKIIKNILNVDNVDNVDNNSNNVNVEVDQLLKQCLDSELCLAFGIQATQIKQLFNNFKDLKYIEPPIQRIGEPSSNGFVNKIKFSRDDYDVYVILKSSATQNSDNLYYEYLIGLEINKWTQIYPTFVDTYGIFLYTSNTTWNYAKNNKIINKNVFLNSLIELPNPTFANSCLKSKYLAIMIQNLRNSNTISSVINNTEPTQLIYFIIYDLPYILFQIYSTLSSMSLNFTHYDLYLNNVLLYQPLKDSYITYHYHLKDEILQFNSHYMAKIIDYGRSYFKETTARICTEISKECKKEVNIGYDTVCHPPKNNNINEDLYLLTNLLLKNGSQIQIVNPELFNILNKVIHNFNGMMINHNISGLPSNINNVNDAFIILAQYVKTNSNLKANIFNYKLGDLHVYLNDKTPMKFIKNNKM